MGEARFTLYAILRIICLRSYFGTVYYQTDSGIFEEIKSLKDDIIEETEDLISINNNYSSFAKIEGIDELYFPINANR